MSGESKPRFPWMRTVFSFLLTLAVGTGAMVLGIELFGDARWTVVVRCLCTGLLVLLTILGALGGAFYTRKMNKLNVRGVNDLVDARRPTSKPMWQQLGRPFAGIASGPGFTTMALGFWPWLCVCSAAAAGKCLTTECCWEI